jgi:hypothetical protein
VARAHPFDGHDNSSLYRLGGTEHSTPRVSWMARCARRRLRKYRGTSVSAPRG